MPTMLLPSALAFFVAASPTGPGDLEWDAPRAEHLLNRAGFGAAPDEIARAVARGAEATVDELLAGPAEGGMRRFGAPREELRSGVFLPKRLTDGPDLGQPAPAATTERFYIDRGRREALGNVRDYCSGWIDSMLRGADPVRDRMAIFWHGHFVSGFEVVRDDRDIIRQVDFLRSGALGGFEELVRGIARDPAMLEYLNNNINEKSHPNENWARELMELFTLGEGNYSEDDIKEAARAYTGWTNRDHEFVFDRHLHDYGSKEVLGVQGNLDGDLVIDILLERPDCARFIAWKLIAYLEGVEPTAERTEVYAAALRDGDYHIGSFLRRLFLDPDFYRDEVRASRVAAPVEYFVGMARRLGVEPPPNLVFIASSLLGQRLFDPPNVKGWEEGMPWMTTGSVMQRSNLVAALLGELGTGASGTATEAFEAMVELRGREFTGPYRDFLAMQAWFEATGWRPERMAFIEDLRAAAVHTDEAIVAELLDRILAVPPEASSATRVTGQLTEWREAAGIAPGALLEAGERADSLLVRLAHLILSLPEAQLN